MTRGRIKPILNLYPWAVIGNLRRILARVMVHDQPLKSRHRSDLSYSSKVIIAKDGSCSIFQHLEQTRMTMALPILSYKIHPPYTPKLDLLPHTRAPMRPNFSCAISIAPPPLPSRREEYDDGLSRLPPTSPAMRMSQVYAIHRICLWKTVRATYKPAIPSPVTAM